MPRILPGQRNAIPQSMNLLRRSEDVSNVVAWTVRTNCTTPTPTRIQCLNDLGVPSAKWFIQTFTSLSGYFTLEFSVRPGTLAWFALSITAPLGVTNVLAYVNGTTGTIGQKFSCTAVCLGPDPARSGYLRFRLQGACRTSANYITIYVAKADTVVTFADDGTGYLDVTAFHLTTANRPGPYVATGASALLGPIRNATPTRNCLPTLQNLLKDSRDFTTANWAKTNCTVSGSVGLVANPVNGAIDAQAVVSDNGVNGNHIMLQNPIPTTIGATCASVYVSAGAKSNMYLAQLGGSASFIDLETGQVTAPFTSGGYPPHLGNGSEFVGTIAGLDWWRVWFAHGGVSADLVQIGPSDAATFTYVGTGVADIHVYGAQVNLGELPTPYIETGASPTTPILCPRRKSQDGLLAAWEADERYRVSGGNLIHLTDLSGQGNGLYQATAGARPQHGAVTLNGRPVVSLAVGKYLEASRMQLAPSCGFTLIALVRPDTMDAGAVQYLASFGSSSAGYSISRVNGTNAIYAAVFKGVGGYGQLTGSVYADGVWAWLGLTYDGVNLQFWKNGVADGAPAALTGNINYGSVVRFVFGNSDTLVANRYWIGQFACGRLFGRGLGADEMLSQYQKTLGKWGSW